jgi:hypothetical protein
LWRGFEDWRDLEVAVIEEDFDDLVYEIYDGSLELY